MKVIKEKKIEISLDRNNQEGNGDLMLEREKSYTKNLTAFYLYFSISSFVIMLVILFSWLNTEKQA